MTKAAVIRRIERRNWLILGVMVAASLLFLHLRFAVGVAFGGALSILGFHTMHGIIRKLLSMPAHKARAKAAAYHYARLGFLFGILALIMAQRLVHPLALVLGLSVVVLNLLLTTLIDSRKIRLEV